MFFSELCGTRTERVKGEHAVIHLAHVPLHVFPTLTGTDETILYYSINIYQI